MVDGASLATMLTGVSAVTAAWVWIRKQWSEMKAQRAATQRRNWHGYIEITSINSWYVRLAEEPDEPTARVVIEVLDKNGQPHPNAAQNLRQRVTGDGMLARTLWGSKTRFGL